MCTVSRLCNMLHLDNLNSVSLHLELQTAKQLMVAYNWAQAYSILFSEKKSKLKSFEVNERLSFVAPYKPAVQARRLRKRA